MDIQESEVFQTSKFFCKTNFDMDEISKEEKDYAIILSLSSIISTRQKCVSVYYMPTSCKLTKM